MKGAANPLKAAGMQAYMKSTMPYHGINMPQLRAISREVFDGSAMSCVEWSETILELWRGARYREERYAAMFLLGMKGHRACVTPAIMPVLEEMIVTGAWWDYVDEIAPVVGDLLRKRFAGAYFLVSGIGVMIAFPFSAAVVLTPFPLAWVLMFVALFFLFFNTGPSNTALANVTRPSVRSMAFALNILIIHALGDAMAPPLIGAIADHTNMEIAFLAVTAMMLVAGVLWFVGMKYLPADTAAVEAQTAE